MQIDFQNDLRRAHAFHAAGQLDEARAIYLRLLRQQPHNANLLHQLGVVVLKQGRYERAALLFRRAIQCKPNFPMAHMNLGLTLARLGRHEEAHVAYERAIAQNPNFFEAHINLGNTLRRSGRIEEALAAHQKAIEINPHSHQAHSNLGNLLRDLGQLDEALTACQRAVELKPDYAEGHCNLGTVFDKLGRLADAVGCYEKAIALRPDFALAHYNLAMALLLSGDFIRGFAAYEWRWRWDGFPAQRWNFPQPLWNDADAQGKTILLWCEQGYGDTFQFIRYAPLVAARGARVIVLCPPEVKSLLERVEGVSEVVTNGDAAPRFDLHLPLLSAPRIFGTTIETIPAPTSYLQLNETCAQKWTEKFAFHDKALRVGLAWAGRPEFGNDRNRSCALETFAPLAKVKGVCFYSLQKGAAAAQSRNPPAGMNMTDWTEELQSFEDTAGFIANLDLVIAVDTGVVHLAGAMGKQVWTLLPFVPDWRWLRDRADSPWYPTMRLFRQQQRGDWGSVMQCVAEELRVVVSRRA